MMGSYLLEGSTSRQRIDGVCQQRWRDGGSSANATEEEEVLRSSLVDLVGEEMDLGSTAVRGDVLTTADAC